MASLWMSLIILFSLNLFSGEKIVFLKEVEDANPELVLFDLSTQKERIIDVGDLNVIYPSISSDGNWIAFSGSEDGRNWGIFILNTKTNALATVVKPKGLSIQPSFSGDMRKLAYTAPVKSRNQIHVLNLKKWMATGKKEIFIIPTVEAAYYPFVNSSGFKVSFHLSKKVDGKSVQNIAIYDLESDELKEFRTKEGKQILGKAPSISFDDRRISYTSQTGKDSWGIAELDLKTEKVSWLTNGEFKDYSPRYMADGSLLFSSNRSGKFRFYKLPAFQSEPSGAKPSIVHESQVNIWDPRVSGDENYMQIEMAPIKGSARSSFGAIAEGDNVYVVGGHAGFEHTYPPESFTKEVHFYNSKTAQWTRLADKINAVHGVTIAKYGNYLYAFGGFAYDENYSPKWKSLDAIERYDIHADKWEIIGRLPEPRSSNAIAIVDHKVFLIGGWDATPQYAGDKNGRFHETIIEFDMKTEAISYAKFKTPQPLRRAFTATVRKGRIIIAGGITQGSSRFNLQDQVRSIDPKKETEWDHLAKLPFPNFAPAIINLQGELFMFGGMRLEAKSYEYVNHIYKLDNAKKQWLHTGRYLSERKGFVQPVSMSNNKVGLLGGHSYDYHQDGPVKTFEVFSSIKD